LREFLAGAQVEAVARDLPPVSVGRLAHSAGGEGD
jgi:hypothetical protein